MWRCHIPDRRLQLCNQLGTSNYQTGLSVKGGGPWIKIIGTKPDCFPIKDECFCMYTGVMVMRAFMPLQGRNHHIKVCGCWLKLKQLPFKLLEISLLVFVGKRIGIKVIRGAK